MKDPRLQGVYWHLLAASYSTVAFWAATKFNFFYCQTNDGDDLAEPMQSWTFYLSQALRDYSWSCDVLCFCRPPVQTVQVNRFGLHLLPPSAFCVCKHFCQHLERLNGYWKLLPEPKECWTMVEIDECLGAFPVTPPHLAGTKSGRCDSQHPSSSQL